MCSNAKNITIIYILYNINHVYLAALARLNTLPNVKEITHNLKEKNNI